MTQRSFFTVLASVVATCLVLAIGGWLWLFSNHPLGVLAGSSVTEPGAAMFVSKQAPLVTSLLVKPDRLDSLRIAVARPTQRRRAKAELAQWKQNILANTGLSYEQDIQPWVGSELTFAVTSQDFDRDPSNGRQAGYLLAVASEDSERSREFLQLFWQKRAIAGTDLVFEQYKGVTVIYGNVIAPTSDTSANEPQNFLASPTLATAVVADRYVLFANHPKVLRDAINNVQAPNLSLAEASFYDQALNALERSRIGLTFINVPGVASWLSGSEPSASATPDQTMAIALGLDRNGLVAETALLTDTDHETTVMPALSEPVAALQYLPALIPFSISGQDLSQSWSSVSDDLNRYAGAGRIIQQVQQDIQEKWQLDLQNDVFAWVKGEYAIGLLPLQSSDRSKSSTPQREWVFAVERTADANEAIAHLDELAAQQGLSVGRIQLGDRTVSAWTRLSAGSVNKKTPQTLQAAVRGVHTTIDNYEVFTTSIAAMDVALQSLERSLLQSPNFKEAIAALEAPNHGYLAVDWAAGRSILEQQFPILKTIELAAKPIVSHVRSLSVASYGTEAGVQRGGVFIRMQ